jgi:F-type H+-transporting ATPase subunit b
VNFLLFATESAEPAEQTVTATFGISWQALLFQAITFLIVVWILKKFVVGKIYNVIDAREKAINDGLNKASQAKKELEKAQVEIDGILKDARMQADSIVATAKKESAELIKASEEKAAKRAEGIVADAQARLSVDIENAKKELKYEMGKIISSVTESILQEKLSSDKDQELISKELDRVSEK